ncbi:hypothetical protein WN59_13115 [Salinicoccus sediminis]|uniref:MmcQ protein n=1 Tax=Salinicoccus sediminis TaxID=1432562 RepID=A0A0M2SFB9_9STAP|nr:MmcQ/YjbR family DNA-binding protein [Salinicoccus sediminis]KKK32973.1 hypothetical protein WN59_13115 [Salinicoccus sediminis]
MLNREDVLDFAHERYGVRPDYPWKKFPNFAVIRHEDNGRWFCLIMDLTRDKLGMEGTEKIDVLNVKVRGEFIGPLRERENIYPAYHMDKNNWVSIVLDFTRNKEDIRDLIAESYELTAG